MPDMLRQFRAVDDRVTLRFNRAFAQARESGTTAPPTLLQRHQHGLFSSAATDVGRTTYGAAVPDALCMSIWRELVDLWVRREDTIRYCLAVHEPPPPPPTGDARRERDARLDLDHVVQTPPPAPPRLSRSESEAEFMVRAYADPGAPSAQ